MGEIKEPELLAEVAQETVVLPTSAIPIQEPIILSHPKTKTWWVRLIIYSSLVLLGQTSATLLARLYYNEGGNKILLAALLESIGFPILIPFALSSSSRNQITEKPLHGHDDRPSFFVLASIYGSLGLSQAFGGVLYAIGLRNLPVSTFSLINTTQLGFSAVFSFFLNAERFTFLILNSLVLVGISSALLIFQRDGEKDTDKDSRNEHFAMGFLCTLAASALYSLTLSITQVVFDKVLKKETFSTVLNMVMYQSMASSGALIVALLASGEWWALGREMGNFQMGELLYVVIVSAVAVGWQVYSIGTVGLIFEVSSLFSNVIGTVALPVVPILAAVFFHESMDGIKVMAIFLAVWGFVSYVYQNYLTDRKNVLRNEVIDRGSQDSVIVCSS